MTVNRWFQILFFPALILLVTKPLGIFMPQVFNRERTFLDPVLTPLERALPADRVDDSREMQLCCLQTPQSNNKGYYES